MTSHQEPGGGGWAAAGPPPPPPPPPTAPPTAASIQFWKQQQQQQQLWCEPPGPERAGTPPDAANFVTTVTVAGWQGGGAPASPRCESARSDAAESSCSSLSQESLSPPARAAPAELAAVRSVTAPARWNRVTRNGLVVYVSPSGVSLTSVEEARQYLRTDGTCKCGLECPLVLEKSFNFDPKVITRPWSSAGGAISPSGATKTCNHRRKRPQLLPDRFSRKDVPPTFQEQRCNPHNNPFFKEQMMQAMEQMSMQQQQLQQQQQQHRLHHQQQQQEQQQQQQHQLQQQQQQMLLQQHNHYSEQPPVPAAAPSSWPRAAPPQPSPHSRPSWEELRRRRQAARGRRRLGLPGRASPCPNVDVRQMERESPPAGCPAAPPPAGPQSGAMPSFLDDPSGYLAQQTQLLNDTMQEGLSPVPPPPPPPQPPQQQQLPAAAAATAPTATEAGTMTRTVRPPEPAPPAEPPPPPPQQPPPSSSPPQSSPSPPPAPVLSPALSPGPAPSPPPPPPPPPQEIASEPPPEEPAPTPSPAPVETPSTPAAPSPPAPVPEPAAAEPVTASPAASPASTATTTAVAAVAAAAAAAAAPEAVVQGAVTSVQHPSASRAPARSAASRAATVAPVRTSVTATPTTVMATPRAPAATRPSPACQPRRATPPTLAPAPPPAAQYQVLGQPDLPLVQSLPAGQIILPSGQVILTQPFQPMLQYVNAFPMQNPLLLPGGGLLQTVEEPRPAAPPPPPPATGRRRRRKPAATVASMLRGQAPAAAQQGVVNGLPTFVVGAAGKPLVLSSGQPGVNFLQPFLLPGAGGQVFIQNMPAVGAPLLSAGSMFPVSGAPQVAAGGQLLQVVSVVGDAAAPAPAAPLVTAPPAAALPPAVVQTPADSSTPDSGGGVAWMGRVSPPQEAGLVSSTVEPADSDTDPDEPARTALKRKRPLADDPPRSGFTVGDLVWGSNQGLDSWPGQVIQRTDVQPCPADRVWVRWFGDHTMSLQPVAALRKFHTHNTAKHKKSHAVNSSFEEALQEALTAVNRQRN